MFGKCDEAKEGIVAPDTFMKCLSMTNLKFGEEECKDLEKKLRANEPSGQIKYQDFLNCCYLSFIYQREEKLKLLLYQLDEQKSGKVSIKTLKEVLSSPEFKFPMDALEKIFTQELFMAMPSDPETLIDYSQFLLILRDNLESLP